MTTQIAPQRVQALMHEGAALIDLRSPAAVARGHPLDAISVPYSLRGLARRIRVALPEAPALLLLAPSEETLEAAARQLAEDGLRVLGTLAGCLGAWRAAGLPERTIGEVGMNELARRPAGTALLDVREPLEWATGHVPGAQLVPLADLRSAVPSLAPRTPVVAICEAGVRSCTAATILLAAGIKEVAHVPEGTSGYRRLGLPLAFPAAEATAG